jgi:hypothetical protein
MATRWGSVHGRPLQAPTSVENRCFGCWVGALRQADLLVPARSEPALPAIASGQLMGIGTTDDATSAPR